MSYNIDRITVLRGTLSIDAAEARAFARKHAGDTPAGSFLSAWAKLDDQCHGPIPQQKISWCHDGSGDSFELFKSALSLTRGDADLVLIWERGDYVSGLKVREGRVEEMDVEFVLRPKKL